MKKHLTILLAIFALFVSLVACTETTANGTTTDFTTALSTNNQTTTEFQLTNDLSEEQLLETTSLELMYYMGNGTNLGNTMEAFGRYGFDEALGADAPVTQYETLWGQPVTTAAMFVGLKAAGFDTVRIPVAWGNTMAYEDGDLTINQDYIDRVGEIVGYALDAGLYVIINDHWDGGWWGMFGSETQSTVELAWDMYEAMWTQVGEYFKDYSYRLIFESANEELGSRLNDVYAPLTEDSGALEEEDCYELTNEINQFFVNLIRAQGGKNADRFLLIAGYNTDFYKTNDDRFEMPEDSAADKLLLSVHYYTPWSYCGTSGDASWGTEDHYETMNELFESIAHFTLDGYGIVIGEWGVLTKSDGSLKNDTIDYSRNMLDNCDLYGYAPMLWDTNAFFKREDGEIFDSELKQLFLDRSFMTQADSTIEELVAAAQASIAAYVAIAIQEDLENGGNILNGDEEAVAWIMYTSLDWSVSYSVGDQYDPTLSTGGIVATDVLIEEAGTYTIGLDFTGIDGVANSMKFAAIGISNGELLFPGYIINIIDIQINGQSYTLHGFPYTSSDDGVCTRVNLYNEWVNEIPDDARTFLPIWLPYATATPVDPDEIEQIETIVITFQYVDPQA